MLTGSFFMLQVYIGCFPAAAYPTLIALIVLTLFHGGLDLVRDRVGARVGRYADEKLSIRAFDALVRRPPKTRADGDGLQPLRELDRGRGYLSGGRRHCLRWFRSRRAP